MFSILVFNVLISKKIVASFGTRLLGKPFPIKKYVNE